ncbi:hypothetical protein P3T73_06935 [Kiritimatiellota bacterium B12222]|nr:hypothetical protein P3T73_06935 [Kiritimatiellota bacterium B12222]
MIRELDWKTPLKSMNMGNHWRIWLGILIFVSLSTAVWHSLYPNTMWFLKLWTGFATGSVLGTFAGVYWQVRVSTRRCQTSGKFLLIAFLGWGAFAVISLVIFAPQMRAEETIRSEMRSLTPQTVLSIEVSDSASRNLVSDRKHIEQFCRVASQAELFYPSHEGSVLEYEITIFLRGGQVRPFRARVPERHQRDLSLGFSGPSHRTEILLPGGGKWIESMVTQEEDSQQLAAQVQSEGAPSD